MKYGWLLLGLSVTAVVICALCAFTPLAWELSGRESEGYPEIVFAVYHLPTAVLLLIDAVLIFRLERQKTLSPQKALWLAAGFKITSLLLLSLPVTFPHSGTNNALLPFFFGNYPLVGFPFHVFMTIRGWRKRSPVATTT
ncbi:hypothetical protein [Asticcacaulis sp. YBE204]|uniref:hypothetical protein n=1 Tax=Asticcacaulis sp. YBE204 TaxID=1282363 RepID=UPI0003C3FD90|nr:hypothetical protein [Asticcacaulis sp. YBE204]ESQ77976.1 hypothetical protein AEYBE204_15890 [Asticcacaulis sp. YBE204]